MMQQDQSVEKIRVLEETDVLVIGAGLGGICAALSAADAGCSVVLTEKNAVLGGQAAEIDTWGLDGFITRQGRLPMENSSGNGERRWQRSGFFQNRYETNGRGRN